MNIELINEFKNEINDVEIIELNIIYENFINQHELYVDDIEKIIELLENKIDELIEKNENHEINEYIKNIIILN